MNNSNANRPGTPPHAINAISIGQFLGRDGYRYYILMSGDQKQNCLRVDEVKNLIKTGRLHVENLIYRIDADGIARLHHTKLSEDSTEERLYFNTLLQNPSVNSVQGMYYDILNKISDLAGRVYTEFEGADRQLLKDLRNQTSAFGLRLIQILDSYYNYMMDIEGYNNLPYDFKDIKGSKGKMIMYDIPGHTNDPMSSNGNICYNEVMDILNRELPQYAGSNEIQPWIANGQTDAKQARCFIRLLKRIWESSNRRTQEVRSCLKIIGYINTNTLYTLKGGHMHYVFILDLQKALLRYLDGDTSALPMETLNNETRKQKLKEVLHNTYSAEEKFRNKVNAHCQEVNEHIKRCGGSVSAIMNSVMTVSNNQNQNAEQDYQKLLDSKMVEVDRFEKDIVARLREKSAENVVSIQTVYKGIKYIAESAAELESLPALAKVKIVLKTGKTTLYVAAKVTGYIRSKLDQEAMKIYNQYRSATSGQQEVLNFIIEWERHTKLSKAEQGHYIPNINMYFYPLFLDKKGVPAFSNYRNIRRTDLARHAQLSWLVAFMICEDYMRALPTAKQRANLLWVVFEDSYRRRIKDRDQQLKQLEASINANQQLAWGLQDMGIVAKFCLLPISAS